ncbi:hypothetical protein HELRODRAFT_73827, partial [Helobdella robusta]|uniref:Uncharacterized protein n=1 Tax=Helobdella robusta TaxID=6412 RepID=T1G1I9_HELRO
MVDLLLKKGADIVAKDIYGNNLLHTAASYGAEKVVEYLLGDKTGNKNFENKNFEIDVNLPNNNGWTPLHIAAEKGNEKLCEHLLQNGAHVDVKSAGGKTALHWASIANSSECVALLLKHSADVSVTDNFGKT